MGVYSLIISSLICIMGLTQLIADFDESKVLVNELNKNNQTSLALRKNLLKSEDKVIKSKYLIRPDKKDKKVIEKYGNDKVYPLYNFGLGFNGDALNTYNMLPETDFLDIYCSETLGTLATEEEYLIKLFGKDNKLEFLAKADEYYDYGIYITDYLADSCINKRPVLFQTYDDLIGNNMFIEGSHNETFYINGIIKTDYKIKHKDAINKLQNSTKFDEKLARDKDVQKFIDDVYQNLSIDYSINLNFKKDYIESCYLDTQLVTNSVFIGDGNVYNRHKALAVYDSDNTLKYQNFYGNDVSLDYRFYNTLFNTNYNESNLDTFVPRKIKFQLYDDRDTKQLNPIFVKELYVKTLNSSFLLVLSRENFKDLMNYEIFEYGYYFDDLNNASNLYKEASDLGFSPVSSFLDPLISITKIVKTFSNLFYLIYGILAIVAIAILINYSLKSIKDKLYEISVLKSLGTTNSDLFFIFSLQTFFIAILVTLFFIIGSFSFVGITNDLLVESILTLTPGKSLTNDITLLFIRPFYLLIDSLIVFLISILSFIIPALKLRNMKPQTIIQKKK